MHKTVKPKALPAGGTIGIVAPAGAVDQNKLEEGIGWLLKQGYQVKPGRYLTARSGYLAGTDRERAADVMSMFLNKRVDAIICARGGYGCMRILPLLDFNLIRKWPKIFVGYSDVTAIHAALQRVGVVSFHGPMVAANVGAAEYSWQALRQVVEEKSKAWFVGDFLHDGQAEGRLVGGNLSIITSLMGTPYELSFKGVILCIEEVAEASYRIDRMLTQLLLSGKLQQLAGLVIGDFENCEQDRGASVFTVPEVMAERLSGLGIPVLTGLHFGHGRENITLPLGVKACISSKEGGLKLLDCPVI